MSTLSFSTASGWTRFGPVLPDGRRWVRQNGGPWRLRDLAGGFTTGLFTVDTRVTSWATT